jgi:hypothetical protein
MDKDIDISDSNKENISEAQPQIEHNIKEEPLEITLGDLSFIVNLIDVCSKRGAFEAKEFVSIGTLRERLVQFIEFNKNKASRT